jgi:hypothetical protein
MHLDLQRLLQVIFESPLKFLEEIYWESELGATVLYYAFQQKLVSLWTAKLYEDD